MKRLLSILALAFLPVLSHAQITIEGTIGNTWVGSGSTITITSGRAVASGEKVIVCVVYHPNKTSVSTISDTGSNTYTQAEIEIGSTYELEVWYSDIGTALAMSDTITVTTTAAGGDNMGATADGYGSVTAGAPSVTGIDAVGFGTQANAGSTGTLPETGMLVHNCAGVNGDRAFTPDAAYTEITEQSGSGAPANAAQYLVVGDTTAQNPDMTWTTNTNWASITTAWTEDGGGGNTSLSRRRRN